MAMHGSMLQGASRGSRVLQLPLPEFGHHVQFEDGLFNSPLTGAEATRRTELMADAFGTTSSPTHAGWP